METTTNTLQLFIENKAKKSLEKDIHALFTSIRDNKLIEDRNKGSQLQVKEGNEWVLRDLYSIVTWSDYKTQLYNHWLPKYIEDATKEFVNKVAELQQQMDELKYDVDNIPHNS